MASFIQVRLNLFANHLCRPEDFRKKWQRKANLHLGAVVVGAIIGGIPSCLDRGIKPVFPAYVIDFAVLISTLVNFAELMYANKLTDFWC